MPKVSDTTHWPTLYLDGEGVALPTWTRVQGVGYTDLGTDFHVIEQTTLRMTAWMNYFLEAADEGDLTTSRRREIK